MCLCLFAPLCEITLCPLRETNNQPTLIPVTSSIVIAYLLFIAMTRFQQIIVACIAMLCPVFLPAQTNARDFMKGRAYEDTSFVYLLPFKDGTKQMMVQGYNTTHSHRYMVAVDFKMKPGTTICAARSGVVIEVREDSDRGGLDEKYMTDWNYLIIQHADTSTALYGHLQQNGGLVKAGDTVIAGQPIALSGNTGYSAFPHLHFQVWDKNGTAVATRFRMRKGEGYLKQMRLYTAVHD